MHAACYYGEFWDHQTADLVPSLFPQYSCSSVINPCGKLSNCSTAQMSCNCMKTQLTLDSMCRSEYSLAAGRGCRGTSHALHWSQEWGCCAAPLQVPIDVVCMSYLLPRMRCTSLQLTLPPVKDHAVGVICKDCCKGDSLLDMK